MMDEIVTRTFDLDTPLRLPGDTVMVVPERRLHVAATTEGAPSATLATQATDAEPGSVPFALRECRTSSDIVDKVLVVSNASATFLVVNKDLTKGIRALLNKETPRQALATLQRTYTESAFDRLRELLTHIAMRNFLEDATVTEFVPHGRHLQFYVTHDCNLRCHHCYVSAGDQDGSTRIGLSDAYRALAAFARVCPGGTVTFTGGEPLTRPDIFSLLDRARSLGLKRELYTNGLLISNANVSALAQRLDLLQISLDGATAAVHDSIRGEGTFRRVVNAIRVVDSHSRDLTTFKYRLAFTLMPVNAEDVRLHLGSLLHRLDLKGNREITIGSANNLGRADGNTECYSNGEDMQATEVCVLHSLASQGLSILPLIEPNRLQRTCGMGGVIGLGPDGSLYPCSITAQPPIGNIKDRDVRSKMRRVRQFVESTNVDRLDGCRDCDIRYLCGGICRIRNLLKGGDYTNCTCPSGYSQFQVRAAIRRYRTFEIVANLAGSRTN